MRTPSLFAALVCAGILSACANLPTHAPLSHVAHAVVPNGCVARGETPSGNVGCFLIAETPMPELQVRQPLFWHITRFATVSAANAAKSETGTVFEAFGQVWLMTIAPETWRAPVAGEFLGRTGPLPLNGGVAYSALYMEATFPPGMITRSHRHSGPEAWYMLEGSQCLETSDGSFVLGPQDMSFVRGDIPMQLYARGSVVRRSLVLILHDAAAPATTLTPDWTPSGACER